LSFPEWAGMGTDRSVTVKVHPQTNHIKCSCWSTAPQLSVCHSTGFDGHVGNSLDLNSFIRFLEGNTLVWQCFVMQSYEGNLAVAVHHWNVILLTFSSQFRACISNRMIWYYIGILGTIFLTLWVKTTLILQYKSRKIILLKKIQVKTLNL